MQQEGNTPMKPNPPLPHIKPPASDVPFDLSREALLISESRYRRLFETALDGILLLNSDTAQIEDVNPYLIQMLGYSHAEFLGKKLWEVGPFADIAQSKEMFVEIQTQGHVRYDDLPLKTVNGRLIEVEFVSNSYDCDGKTVIQCNIRDVTARKNAERALQLRELKYKAVTTSATDAFVTGSMAGQIVGWNPSAERIFGYTEAEAIGQPLTLLIPQSLQNQHLDGMRRINSSDERRIVGKTVELLGRRKNGSEFPLEISLAEWTDGEKPFFTGIIRDITERKEADAVIQTKSLELAESNAELEKFAYVASHDLREPLRMVSSFLTLLERRNSQLDKESLEFLAFAKEGAVRMDHMVLALLEFSRIGHSSGALCSVDSGIAIAEAIFNLSALIKDTDCAVFVVDTMPEVMANRDELLRLFQNLIGNAIKYRRHQVPPVIRISNRHEDSKWTFSVADNGIGIDSDYHERIFEIFQRLHTRDQYEGTGIGLAICKKIVEHHGGSIWVDSVPGQGTTFHFTWPDIVGKGP